MELTRKRLVLLGGIAAIIVVWVIAALFWPTDRKWIAGVLNRAAAAAEKADSDAVMALVADDYRVDDMDRDEFERIVRDYFRNCGPTAIRFLKRDPIAITGRRAVTQVLVFAQSDPHSRLPLRGRSLWRISFRKRGGRWLIARIEPLQFESRQVEGWREVPRFGE